MDARNPRMDNVRSLTAKGRTVSGKRQWAMPNTMVTVAGSKPPGILSKNFNEQLAAEDEARKNGVLLPPEKS